MNDKENIPISYKEIDNRDAMWRLIQNEHASHSVSMNECVCEGNMHASFPAESACFIRFLYPTFDTRCHIFPINFSQNLFWFYPFSHMFHVSIIPGYLEIL